MLDRRPERLDRLPGECPARQVDDGDADPEWHLRRDVVRGGDRGLRIQRVEDRLDQEQVDAPVDEAPNLLGVRLDDLVEGMRAEARLVDARAQRECDVERADRASNAPVAGDLARDLRARDVHVVDGALERVIGLADRRRGKRVRRRDVGAGREVRLVHRAHGLGPRQVEQVGVVPDVVRMIREPLAAEVRLGQPLALQEDAPGAVEDEDALLGCSPDVVCDVSRHSSSLGV